MATEYNWCNSECWFASANWCNSKCHSSCDYLLVLLLFTIKIYMEDKAQGQGLEQPPEDNRPQPYRSDRQIFCLEHIRPLREELLGAHIELPTELPLLLPWFRLLKKKLKGNTRVLKPRYDNIFDNFTLNDLIVNPYQRLDLGHELAMACSVTVCINFLDIAHHRPDMFRGQYGFAPVDNAPNPQLSSIKPPVSKFGPKKKVDMNTDERFRAYRDEWYGRVPLRGALLDDWAPCPWMVDVERDPPLVPNEEELPYSTEGPLTPSPPSSMMASPLSPRDGMPRASMDGAATAASTSVQPSSSPHMPYSAIIHAYTSPMMASPLPQMMEGAVTVRDEEAAPVMEGAPTSMTASETLRDKEVVQPLKVYVRRQKIQEGDKEVVRPWKVYVRRQKIQEVAPSSPSKCKRVTRHATKPASGGRSIVLRPQDSLRPQHFTGLRQHQAIYN